MAKKKIKELTPIEVPETPIMDTMFIRQGWEQHFVKEETPEGEEDDSDEDFGNATSTIYYWLLPLPKDNPDPMAPCFISSVNDEWDLLELEEGEYTVEIANSNGIGLCDWEEEIEILYRALTGEDINEKYTDNLSVK
jgi:hypothetical protein